MLCAGFRFARIFIGRRYQKLEQVLQGFARIVTGETRTSISSTAIALMVMCFASTEIENIKAKSSKTIDLGFPP